MRVLALLATATIAVVGLQSPTSAAADMDCANFGSQKAAQIFFLNNNPAADPHNLDSDGDWVVCESNPGPYYYGRDPNPDSKPTPVPVPVKTAPAPLKVVKVLEGDLVRLRQGSAKPFDVRLIGLKVPGNDSCMTNGARRFLKDIAKPGRIVTVIKDKKSPQRDGQGNIVAEVKPKNGNARSGFSNKVVTNGWAKVQSYKFGAKRTYLDLMAHADEGREGLFGECIENYGSSRYPYEVGTFFEVDGWRYSFGATDFDALPEMTAEKAAAAPGTYTFTPPSPGATFRRVPVTAARLDTSAMAAFGYVYGDTIEETTMSTYGSCGTAPNLLDQMTVAPGQTVTGYLCTAKPATGELDEMWAVANPKTYYVSRFVVSN